MVAPTPPGARAAQRLSGQSRLLAATLPTLAALAAPRVSALPAQTAPPLAGEYAVEQQVRDRWMHGRQRLHQEPRRRAVFLLADSVPAPLREKWKDRVSLIAADEWRRRSPREAGVLYTLSSVRRVGPFVSVGVSAGERLARGPDQAPQMYASGTRYYLMELNGEWVVVGMDDWVT